MNRAILPEHRTTEQQSAMGRLNATLTLARIAHSAYTERTNEGVRLVAVCPSLPADTDFLPEEIEGFPVKYIEPLVSQFRVPPHIIPPEGSDEPIC